jgi:hypothetical protein
MATRVVHRQSSQRAGHNIWGMGFGDCIWNLVCGLIWIWYASREARGSQLIGWTRQAQRK